MGTLRLPFYARLALTLLALVLIFIILRAASGIVIPLVFALLVAILLYPFNMFLENRLRFSRAAAAITSVSIFIVGLGSFVYFLALQMVSFSSDFPELKPRFSKIFDDFQHWLSFKLHINKVDQKGYIHESANSLLGSVAHSISGVFVSVTGILLLLVFIFLFTFFILYHRNLLRRFVLHLFSDDHRPKVLEVIMETKGMINAYVQGLLIEMALVGIANCVTLLFLGVQYAILLGVMAAVLNIIPYLGIYSSIVICMLLTFANSSASLALEVGLALFIIHLIDSNVLFPRVVGGRVKMNPFISILAVVIGQSLWGVPGMFLFIPIVGMLKLVCDRVEGLQAWGLLIGVDDTPPKTKRIKVKK